MLKVIIGKKKRPQGAQEIEWGKLPIEEVASLAATDALFGGDSTYVLVGTLYSDRGSEFLALAKDFAQSPHTFIFEEEKLLKKETDALTKAGAKIEKVEVVKKERGFDPFGVTYALGNRDKKALWLSLMKAFEAGEKAEAVAGLMHWKVRDMLAKSSSKYSRADLTALSRAIVFMYHDSHRGLGDLDLLLERFALTLN